MPMHGTAAGKYSAEPARQLCSGAAAQRAGLPARTAARCQHDSDARRAKIGEHPHKVGCGRARHHEVHLGAAQPDSTGGVVNLPYPIPCERAQHV